jgi:DNA-directed RNA polymerase subunit E'/Rpb7
MEFEEELIITPDNIEKDLKNKIKAKLIQKVIGKCTEKYGYIIYVIKIFDIENGVIMDTTGDILFNIKYRAIVMKPLLGEVVEGYINKVHEYGITAVVGPMEVYISKPNFPNGFEFHKETMNFINEEGKNFEENSNIRFRIIANQFENNEFKPAGSMNENYLGAL